MHSSAVHWPPALRRSCTAGQRCWGGLRSRRLSPGQAEVASCLLAWPASEALLSGRGLPRGPERGWPPRPRCPCTPFPSAAPDCARQNCRCQALHRKESEEGGRGRDERGAAGL